MRLGKKIIGIVMSAFTLLLAVLYVVFIANSVTSIVDLANFMNGLPSSYDAGQFAKEMVIEIMRLFVALALAILCGVTGGINLGKSIKGRSEAILNRVNLFVVFDFLGVAAAITYMGAYADTLQGQYIGSIIAYAITMLIFIIGITVVSTMARRRAIAPGRKLAAGIMLAVTATLMVTVMIIEHAAAPEILAPRYTAYRNAQSLRDLYSAFEIIAVFVGIFGTFAMAGLNIAQGAIEKRRGVQPAPKKAEVKEEAKPEEK